MGFSIRTIQVVEYDYVSEGERFEQLLAVFAKGNNPFFVYASFDNYPMPTPYFIDLQLLPPWLQQWYDQQLAEIRSSLTPEQRDAIGSRTARIHCDLEAEIGRSITLHIKMSRRDKLVILGNEITELRPVTRAEAEALHVSV